ncbi:MAG: chloramphenicol phosphotransferase CPT family protein [Tumebacillaceae bacterium]
MTNILILNGGSSSGKTSIAKSLQDLLPTPWLHFSIDDLLDAMPSSMFTTDTGIVFDSDGSVNPGSDFRTLEAAWMQGIAAIVRAGTRVIVDDVFISGVEARKRWQVALEGLDVLWVGVRCDPAVATAREMNREDRITDMAASQALKVHMDMDYDLEVDTTETSTQVCAQMIADKIRC